MPQINLLPWREERRERKKNEFLLILGFFIALTILLILLIHFYLAGKLSRENDRITFLQQTIATKQTDFTALKEQKQKEATIEDELNFILSLRTQNFRIIQLMNELVKIIPPSVTLTKLILEKDNLTLRGKAQAELQVTALMKNIANSTLFLQPLLTNISDTPELGHVFEINVGMKKSEIKP